MNYGIYPQNQGLTSYIFRMENQNLWNVCIIKAKFKTNFPVSLSFDFKTVKMTIQNAKNLLAQILSLFLCDCHTCK